MNKTVERAGLSKLILKPTNSPDALIGTVSLKGEPPGRAILERGKAEMMYYPLLL